ncbi:MAG: VWA domain-containing protein [Microscillaceae bacterium]|jgi:Mg-chelatase subunit ChlD|nr:VWA domain-containing protein [Microscillaceae bacterium]
MLKKNAFFLILFCFLMTHVEAQNNKAINTHLKFANEATKYVEGVMDCLKKAFDSFERYKAQKAKNREPQMGYAGNFKCSPQVEEYYYQEALKANLPALNPATQAVWEALAKIDQQAKQLEIYVRLEEYKTDWAKGEKMMNDLPALFKDYRLKIKDLFAVAQRNRRPAVGNYATAETQLNTILGREAQLLEAWNFNFNDQIGTGWITDLIGKNTLENDEILRKTTKSNLPYPANSFFDSCIDGLRQMQDTKRDGLDKYNVEARLSDTHSNWVYMTLKNYYNGVLVSFFNTLSEQSGNSILYAPYFVPNFEIKTEAKKVEILVKPFQDKPRPDFSLSKQSAPIARNVLQALNNYLDFINEAYRLNKPLIWSLRNYQSSANYIKESGRKSSLSLRNENYTVPKSFYQKAVADSKFLPAGVQNALNTQAEVLLNILTELEQLNADLTLHTLEKKYEKDNLKHSDEALARFKVVLEAFDEKKEQLYNDVRKIAEAYAPIAGSWTTSGNALLKNSDLSKDITFTARDFFKGKSTTTPSENQIASLESDYKNLIIKEYDNMKGIERIGRNHGLCPYNPYEDIPNYAKTLVEKTRKFETLAKPNNAYNREPYNDFVYLHNEIIAEYNRFTEISTTVPLLKNVYQPEIFLRQAPKTKTPPTETPVEEPEIKREDEDPEYLKTMTGYATNNLVFLLDVSSSMNAPEKMPLLKKSIKYLVSIMRPEDEISLVIYSGNAQVILEGVSAQKTERIYRAIDKLESQGKTNGEAGIRLAYETVEKNFIEKGNNRIILATDGEFPMSEKTLNLASEKNQKDIHLTVFSFGKLEKRFENLIKLAQQAQGNYEHITEENANLKLIKEAKAKKAN